MDTLHHIYSMTVGTILGLMIGLGGYFAWVDKSKKAIFVAALGLALLILIMIV